MADDEDDDTPPDLPDDDPGHLIENIPLPDMPDEDPESGLLAAGQVEPQER